MWACNFSNNCDFGTTPTILSTTSPFLKTSRVGIFLTPNLTDVSELLSTSNLPITA